MRPENEGNGRWEAHNLVWLEAVDSIVREIAPHPSNFAEFFLWSPGKRVNARLIGIHEDAIFVVQAVLWASVWVWVEGGTVREGFEDRFDCRKASK